MKCKACRTRSSITIDGYAPLCGRCLDRTGDGIKAGRRVVCEVDDSCSGIVARMVDGYAVIETHDGGEAWIPTAELVAC